MNRVLGALLAFSCALPALGAREAKSPRKEKRVMEWSGAFCPVAEPAVVVARTAREWEKIWEKIGRAAPAADLSKHFAVAVFLGTRNTGGYGVLFEEPGGKAGTLVRYRVRKPRGMVIQALTQPYAVRLFPKAGGRVVVEARED